MTSGGPEHEHHLTCAYNLLSGLLDHSQVYIIHCILLMAELFTNVKCTVDNNPALSFKKKEIELYVVFVSKSLCCRSTNALKSHCLNLHTDMQAFWIKRGNLQSCSLAIYLASIRRSSSFSERVYSGRNDFRSLWWPRELVLSRLECFRLLKRSGLVFTA